MNTIPLSEALTIATNTQTAGTTVMEAASGFRIEGNPGSVSAHVQRLVDQGLRPSAVSTVQNRSVAVYNSGQWNEQLHPRDKGKFKTKAELEKEAAQKAAAAKESAKTGADKSVHQEAGAAKLEALKKGNITDSGGSKPSTGVTTQHGFFPKNQRTGARGGVHPDAVKIQETTLGDGGAVHSYMEPGMKWVAARHDQNGTAVQKTAHSTPEDARRSHASMVRTAKVSEEAGRKTTFSEYVPSKDQTGARSRLGNAANILETDMGNGSMIHSFRESGNGSWHVREHDKSGNVTRSSKHGTHEEAKRAHIAMVKGALSPEAGANAQSLKAMGIKSK